MEISDIFNGNLTPKKWKDLGVYLKAAKVIAGPGLRVSHDKIAGTKINLVRGPTPPASGTATGPFCGTYISGDEWFLTGGAVSSGATAPVIVPDIVLGDTNPVPTDGTHIWLVCTGTALVIDGNLMLQFDLATAVIGTVAVNTIPTAAAPGGVLHISLGSWSNGAFVPSGCGNIGINHCPGSLSSYRV